ncbi:MAG: serine hydrolase [Ferruginibacter sp.]
MKKLFLFLLLSIAAIAFTSFGKKRQINSVNLQLDNLLRWEEKFGFTGSVLVVKDGKIILNKGYGYANKNQGWSNTPKTAFYIASVSKPITALGVMKLVEEKKISLSDPITKYFQNVPDNKKSITIEMLLTHTSGLEHTYSCDDITDRRIAIETILNKTPLVAPPGNKYNYSGDNYTLLAAIIDITSGDSFENYVAKNILQPAGITHPAFTGYLDHIRLEDYAAPSGNSSYKSLKNIDGTWGRKGRAGMVLSVEDLYKLDKAFSENKIFQAGTTENILSPKIKNNTTSENYGYGFSLGTTIRGTKVFGHSGDDDGVGHNVEYLDFPDENVKIFIASNSGMYSGTSWTAVISSMLQRFLFKSNYNYTADKLYYNEFQNYSSIEVEKLEGVYKNGNTDYHVWINNNGQLIVSPVGEEVAETFGYSKAYSQKNQLTKSILEEAIQQQFNTLQASAKDNASFEKLKATFSSVLKTLTEKNGSLEKIEILGTANTWSGNYHADIATWFKLVFKNKTQQYRLEWDGNNKIAGIAGTRMKYPIMFTLNVIAKHEFIGFDPGNGRTIAVNFLTQNGENKNMMELSIGDNKPLVLANSGELQLLPKRSAAEVLYNTMLTNGIPAAIAEATAIKEKLDRFDADEGELNDFGYKLLNDNKLNEAITMFSILVQAFPESANGFDSLGEAYMKAGNKADAIKNYKRSLELDPKNENAKKIIEKMQ